MSIEKQNDGFAVCGNDTQSNDIRLSYEERHYPRKHRKKKLREQPHVRPLFLLLLLMVIILVVHMFFSDDDRAATAQPDQEPLVKISAIDFHRGDGTEYAAALNGSLKAKIPARQVVLPELVMRNPAATHKVCLTFDDGPYPGSSEKYLEILKEKNTPAVFFLLGSRVLAYPAAAKSIQDSGQEFASHSYDHKNLAKLTGQALKDDFDATDQAFEQVFGKSAKYLRPPYGENNAETRSVSLSYGLQPIYWSIDTRDWQGLAADILVQRVVNSLHNGAIILFHEGKANTLEALPQVIDAVRAAGYEFATLDELLSNYPSE